MSRRVSLVTIVVMVLGFVYAARATAVRYVAIVMSPFEAHHASSIDPFLRPAQITSAELRRSVRRSEWRHIEEVAVLAADRTISREDLYQVYYSAGYLLYPMKVRLSENLTSPANRVGVLVFGGANPFIHAQVAQLSARTALVMWP